MFTAVHLSEAFVGGALMAILGKVRDRYSKGKPTCVDAHCLLRIDRQLLVDLYSFYTLSLPQQQ